MKLSQLIRFLSELGTPEKTPTRELISTVVCAIVFTPLLWLVYVLPPDIFWEFVFVFYFFVQVVNVLFFYDRLNKILKVGRKP